MTESQKFIEDLIKEINLYRNKPISCVANLQKHQQYILKYYSYKTNILNDIEALSKKLTSKSQVVPEWILDENLSAVAEDFLNRLESTRGKKFYAQDQEYLEVALGLEFEGVKVCKNYLNTDATPGDVVLNIWFKEGEWEEGKHIMLEKSIKYVGLAHGIIKETPVTITIFSDSVKQVQPKPWVSSLVDEINKIRAYPRSYIKYIPTNKGDNKKRQEIIDFLTKAKPSGKLLTNESLNTAAEKRAEKWEEDNWALTYDQLIQFLSEFGEKYLNVVEYTGEVTDTPKDFILKMIMFKQEIREWLFNRKFNYISVADTKSTGQIVLLFADNFDEKAQSNTDTLFSLRKRLHRPDFTADELAQMERDFKKWDILNEGTIQPRTILWFMGKDKNFKTSNPIYYAAFKLWNTEENNANGIDVNEFINGVKSVIREKNADIPVNYEELFNLYFEGSKKKTPVISKDILTTVIQGLGFKASEEEISELVTKMDGELNLEKFIVIMKYVELRFVKEEIEEKK